MIGLEFVGWTAGILFAVSGAPEAYRSWKYKRCYVGWGMLLIWLTGEILATIYMVVKTGFGGFPPMIFNYLSNIFFITVLLHYKINGRPVNHIDRRTKEKQQLKKNLKIAENYAKKMQ